MSATVPYAYESRVINHNIDKTWTAIRNLDFKFCDLVKKVDINGESGLGKMFYNFIVGGTRVVTYTVNFEYILCRTVLFRPIKS